MVVFRPLHDRVAIRHLDAEAKSAGGIIIPDTAQEKPQPPAATPHMPDMAGKGM